MGSSLTSQKTQPSLQHRHMSCCSSVTGTVLGQNTLLSQQMPGLSYRGNECNRGLMVPVGGSEEVGRQGDSVAASV